MVNGLFGNLSVGIILGLILGKPIGITLMSFIAVKLKISALPKNTNWFQMIGLGLLAGIGFTMAIFIALLSFSEVEFQTQAKFSILVGSILSGCLGFLLLKYAGKKKKLPEVASVK
jgi:NhaA family Na+:H+ antiporter